MKDSPSLVPLEKLLTHREWVRRLALALVGDPDRAADLEQEAWVAALENRPRSEGAVRGWFRTVLKRKARDQRRSAERRGRREEAAARPEGTRATAEVVAEADALKRVVVAVLDLAEPYRETVLLRYFEDVEAAAVAAQQGIPVETVRTRLKRAVALLRERLDAEERGDRRRWRALLLPLARRGPHGPPIEAAGGSSLAAAAGVLAMTTKAKVGAAAVLVGVFGLALFATMVRRVNDVPGGSGAADPGSVGWGIAVSGGMAQPVPHPKEDPVATRDDQPPGAPDSIGWLRGRVVDARGEPVAGARVLSGALQPGSDPVREVVAVADDSGGFSILLDRSLGWLWAEAPGHVPSRRLSVIGVGPDAGPVDLELRGEAARIEGRVIDDQDRPLHGATVRTRLPSRLSFDPEWSEEPLRETARTGADGRYAQEGLPAGPREVVVDCPDWAPTVMETNLTAGEITVLDVRLSAGAVLYGTLLSSEGGPAAGARVVLVGMNGLRDRETTTGETGAYRFEAVREGGAWIRASDGAGSSFEGGTGVRNGQSSRLDGHLVRRDSVRGRIVDARGAPLAGWRLTLYLRTAGRLTPLVHGVADEAGRFEMQDPPPGDLVVGAAPGPDAVPRMIGRPQGETVTIDTVVPTGFVTGAVVAGPDSGPLRLRVRLRNDPAETWLSRVLRAGESRLRVELPAGTYIANMTTEDGGLVELGSIAVNDGDETDIGVVDMTRLYAVTLVVGPRWDDKGFFQLFRKGTDGVRTPLLIGSLREEIRARLSDGNYVFHAEGPDLRTVDQGFTVEGVARTVHLALAPSPGVAFLRLELPGHAGESAWLTVREAEGAVAFDGLVKMNAQGWTGAGMNVEPGRVAYRLEAWKVFEGEVELVGSPPVGVVQVR